MLALTLVCSLVMPSGCKRAFYRQRADRDVYGLVKCGSTDPRWQLPNYTIEPDPASRMYDPNDPDCPPMPRDDPASHRLMHCVDCKEGWPCWDRNGTTTSVENPSWQSFLPYNEDHSVLLDRGGAVRMALLNSREYQQELEDLYTSALNVSFERFQFDTKFFGGNATFFSLDGPVSGQADFNTSLDTDTAFSLQKTYATGANLVVDVANSVVWQFAGADGHTAITPLNFSLVQPLLRGAGRAVVLENLTDSERALLANIRQLVRFQRGFYIQIVAGRSAGPGPSPGGIGLGSLSPGGTSGVGGYLALLEQQLQIRNQRANVAALRDSLERISAFYDAGRISRRQVDEILQNLYSSQINLLSRTTDYRDELDRYKITLGLPPHLEVSIEDPLLGPFNLINPSLTNIEGEFAAVEQPARTLLVRIAAAREAMEAIRQANQSARLATEAAKKANYSEATAILAQAAKIAAIAAEDTGSADAATAARSAAIAAEVATRVDDEAKPAKIAEAVEALGQSTARAAAAADTIGVDVVRLAPNVLKKALDEVTPILGEFEAHVASVQRDIRSLNTALPLRRRHLQRLTAKKEFQTGDIDPGVADIDALNRRVVELNVDFFGKADPSVQKLATDLLDTPAERRHFEQLRDVPGLAKELPDTLLELTKLRREAAQGIPDATDKLGAWADQLERLRGLLNRLSSQVLAMSLLQAKARLDTSTLVPIDLAPEAAVEIARQNRLDWMNARAALVDQWRKIEVVANNLQSDLDLTFDGGLTQTSSTLNGTHNTKGNLQLGLEFDAPLTRLAERNAYRQTLIDYQQARRQYYAFEDQVSRVLRDTLRSIELTQLQFELQRAAVYTAIARVEQQRLELQRPPKPGEELFTLGPTTARDLVTALDSLLREQNSFLNSWVTYEVLRMGLDFDMGTMRLDARGMWVDPGPIEAGSAVHGDAPELVPPPEGVPRDNHKASQPLEIFPDLSEVLKKPPRTAP